jgi:hypothetical protein
MQPNTNTALRLRQIVARVAATGEAQAKGTSTAEESALLGLLAFEPERPTEENPPTASAAAETQPPA